MTDAQIKHMVDRFLMWTLPENFHPDGGVSFDPIASKGTPHEFRRVPSGTNLFDATQATEMVRHMLEGLPAGEKSALAHEKVRAAFAAHWKNERQRAEKCVYDVCDILNDPDDRTPLTDREEIIVAKLQAYLQRDLPYSDR